MAQYHGKKGLVYMSSNGTGAAASASFISDWTLDMSADRDDMSAMGDANKHYVQGLSAATGTLSGVWDDTSDTLYDIMGSSDGTKIYLYPSSLVTAKYFYGPAWLDMQFSGGVAAGVKWSATFAANGDWGQQ